MRGGSNNRHEGNNAREMWNAWNPTMEAVVLWGAQTSASGAAYAARANADMRERGIKTIVVDPYFTEEAAKADIWLPGGIIFRMWEAAAQDRCFPELCRTLRRKAAAAGWDAIPLASGTKMLTSSGWMFPLCPC